MTLCCRLYILRTFPDGTVLTLRWHLATTLSCRLHPHVFTMLLRWHCDAFRHRLHSRVLTIMSSAYTLRWHWGAELRSAGGAGLGVDTGIDTEMETDMSASRVEEKVHKQSPAFM